MHPRKNLILGEKPEISLKADFFEVGKKFIPLMCLHDAAKLSLWFWKKSHVLEKFLSQVTNENTLDQSDCKIFKIVMLQKLFEV